MINDPKLIIQEFCRSARSIGLVCGNIEHEVQQAPHEPHPLPKGKCAVYVFSLSEAYGKYCPAGSGRVLKVGKAGPNSNARFQSQHYKPGRAPSTFAATLVTSRILWPYLGITQVTSEEVEDWIKYNTDRDNFYFDSSDAPLLSELEKYIKGRLGPAFEGG